MTKKLECEDLKLKMFAEERDKLYNIVLNTEERDTLYNIVLDGFKRSVLDKFNLDRLRSLHRSNDNENLECPDDGGDNHDGGLSDISENGSDALEFAEEYGGRLQGELEMNQIGSKGIGIGIDDKIREQLTETFDKCYLIGSQVNDVNMPSDDTKEDMTTDYISQQV